MQCIIEKIIIVCLVVKDSISVYVFHLELNMHCKEIFCLSFSKIIDTDKTHFEYKSDRFKKSKVPFVACEEKTCYLWFFHWDETDLYQSTGGKWPGCLCYCKHREITPEISCTKLSQTVGAGNCTPQYLQKQMAWTASVTHRY